MGLHLMSFAFQLKNLINISLVQVSWQTTLFYFIYWKCSHSTLKFEGYFCWIWNSKLTVLFCLFHHFLFIRQFKPISPLVLSVCCLPCTLPGQVFNRFLTSQANCWLSSFISCYWEISVSHTIQNQPSPLWLSPFPVCILCNISTMFVFPCFLSFYVNSSTWKFTLYSLIFLALGEISAS